MSARRELEAQRAARLAEEARTTRELARAYQPAWQRIRDHIDQLTQDIAAAQKRGETIDAGWLAQHGAADTLAQQTAVELRVYAEHATRIVDSARRAAYEQGAQDAADILKKLLPPGLGWTPTLPVRATAQIAAQSAPHTPLGDLLAENGRQAAEAMRESLITGIATGTNPRVVARELKTRLAGDGVRALRVARTETMRAYRTAAIGSYRENQDVVTGWVWIAELGSACPVCVAMHGTEHGLDEDLDSHPSCRCTMAPKTVSWEDLGFPGLPETSFDTETGVDWFARQPESKQLQILGPGKFAAYQQGSLTLPDLVQPTFHPVWGRGLRERALRDAVTA